MILDRVISGRHPYSLVLLKDVDGIRVALSRVRIGDAVGYSSLDDLIYYRILDSRCLMKQVVGAIQSGMPFKEKNAKKPEESAN